MKVQNKVIVVTGGENGMGREMILNLLSRGASVAAVDINEAALQETTQLAGGKKCMTKNSCINCWPIPSSRSNNWRSTRSAISSLAFST